MKTLKKLLIVLAAGLLPALGFAEGLVPTHNTFDWRGVYYPVSHASFYFGCRITVVENAVMMITDGENIVATSEYITNETYKTQGVMQALFEPPLLLPIGKTYTLVAPKDVAFSEADPTVSNDELRVDFTVPGCLRPKFPSIQEGQIIVSESRMGFYFDTETEYVEGGGEIVLYREGIPVRSYPCEVSWDWDLGYAGARFGESYGEKINFDAGVNYSLVLKAGSVRARGRADIVNEELSVNFTGGYEAPPKTLKYAKWKPFGLHGNTFGGIILYYDQEVALAPGAKGLLVDENRNVLCESAPVLTIEDGYWVVTFTFNYTYPPDVPSEFEIVIPEGTIVTPRGDVIVNTLTSIPVDPTNAAADIEPDTPKVTLSNNILSINSVRPGALVTVYAVDGVKVFSAIANSGHLSVNLPKKGVYILSIDGRRLKIL